MRHVLMTAWRRPDYTRRALEALYKCRGIDDFQVVVLIDRLPDGSVHKEVARACRCAGDGHRQSVLIAPIPLGVAQAPIVLMERSFEVGTDFIVKIEDDAVLAPDALELALWYESACNASKWFLDRYTLMALGCHDDKTGGPPELLEEHGKITMPFAFCLHRHHWPFVQRVWNCKKTAPFGWDWSLTYAMRLERRRTLAPQLSRCENIGKRDGVHDTPETWKEMQVGVPHSDGSYHSRHYFVEQQPPMAMELETWMQAEYDLGTRP